jgi:hypothetical protein
MNAYNAGIVEAAMKSPVEPRPMVYKPAAKPATAGRSGSTPWGTKRERNKLKRAMTVTDEYQQTVWQTAKISGLTSANNSRLFNALEE